MSKRSYPVWDYPSNTKTNPIPPTAPGKFDRRDRGKILLLRKSSGESKGENLMIILKEFQRNAAETR